MINPNEHEIQSAIVDWSKLKKHNNLTVFDYLIKIPNEAKRSYALAARLKKEGLKAGVSDLFLALPSNGYFGLWLEIKAKRGRVTEAQAKFIDKMVCVGYVGKVAYSAEQAINMIDDYLGDK